MINPYQQFIADDPYDVGYRAGSSDDCVDCPFTEDSHESVEWWNGYNAGAYDAATSN